MLKDMQTYMYKEKRTFENVSLRYILIVFVCARAALVYMLNYLI